MAKNELINKKVVLVTGASSNLGKIIVSYLPTTEMTIYAGYNSGKLFFKSNDVIPIKINVTDLISIKSAIKQVLKYNGKIDVLINCAGVSKAGKMEDSTIEDFDKLLDVNTKGAYRMIHAVLPIMKKQKSGKIINITSMSGLIAFPNFGIYSASKFALEAFTTSLRYEVVKDNIWVTNIEPGAITSESNKKVTMPHKTFREKYLLARLILPLVHPSEIASRVEEVVNLDRPPANVLVGRDIKIANFAKRILPTFVWDRLLQIALS